MRWAEVAALALTLQVHSVGGLVVFTHARQDQFNRAPSAIVYEHATAKFGAQQPYNVTGRLVSPRAEERSGCKHLNTTQVQGKVVLLVRGGCNFIVKAKVAKAAGAVAIIIGDNDPSSRQWLNMHSGSEEESAALGTTIPVVFIQGITLYDLQQKLKNPESPPFYATLDTTKEMTSNARHAFNPHPRHPLLPFVWLMLGLSYWTRRMMSYYVARRQRRPAVENMAMVDYVALEAGVAASERESSANSHRNPRRRGVNASPELVSQLIQSTTPQQVINPTCTVCFEDFESGEQVKALPCGHGFHAPCIDPWLLNHSDRCPVCNRSILNPPPAQVVANNRAGATVASRRTAAAAAAGQETAAAAGVRAPPPVQSQPRPPQQGGVGGGGAAASLGGALSHWGSRVHAWVARTRRASSPGSEE